MKNPPILISVIGFFAALAGFAWIFLGFRISGFHWFTILGDVGQFEQSGLWGWLAIGAGILWLLVAVGLWALQPWAWLFGMIVAGNQPLRGVPLGSRVPGDRPRPGHVDHADHHHPVPELRRREGRLRHEGPASGCLTSGTQPSHRGRTPKSAPSTVSATVTSSPRPGPPGFHLLAKPTGATCNLDCAYCFFLSKEMLYPGSRFRMADELLEAYIRQLIEAQRVPEVTIAWQGGEPTLMGLDFFRRAMRTWRSTGGRG